MANLSLRGCDQELLQALRRLSAARRISVNRLILETLADALLGAGKKPRRYHDLDELAGTWSVAEANHFDRVTAAFSTVDRELWQQ